MTTKYTFFIGLADKDAKVQIIDTMSARAIVERVFVKNGCDGATITGGHGIYRHESTFEVISEYTLIVQLFDFSSNGIDVRGICDELKTLLNQESIAVERREVESALY